MPAQRMTFAVPITESAGFVPDALIDDVWLPDRRLADGAVVASVDLPEHDAGMAHVTLDVYT